MRDESYVVDYLKQSIELTEKFLNPALDYVKLQDLLSVDFCKNKNSMTELQENAHFDVLQGNGAGKAITNLSEYLMMTLGRKGETKVS